MTGEFTDRFWAVREWSEAEKVAQERTGDIARLAQAGFAEFKTMNEAGRT